ncbi:FAD-dependent monooxygenase [Pseudonocardia sp. RS11V-5]|uniref:FAD-dependent monooxygenase n=1 Tax=Pseudonocardia terrae TaxID=2905831 RepID=UPI001E4D5A15|nr:FAD-dependent monooxygenase [Pseudonocardia terrae]MCE3555755.1 FAD-dependent monooxygenase [Pseudonocardia terrae]
MRIACVGAGPGGLFFAILATRIPGVTDVTVYEQAAEGAPRGWGVVFWPDLMDQVEAVDPPFAEALRTFRYTWRDQVVEVDGSEARFTASGFAMGRHLMQKLLVDRAREVGVRIEFDRRIGRLAELEGYDLVVAADGVRSGLREQAPGVRTEVTEGRNRYIWLGTEKQFSSFTFPFVHSPGGWLWAHAYAFGEAGSTFIVETTEETWRALGLDTLGPDETLRLLESVFADQLDGHKLVLQEDARETAPWRRFATVRNSSWTDGPLALVGDAAHTTHFSVGSGTRLALEDAIALARHLEQAPTVAAALAGYGTERAEALEVTAGQARSSAAWFEAVPQYVERPVRDFARLLIERRRLVARRAPGLYLALHRLTTVPVLGALVNHGLAAGRAIAPRVIGPLRRRLSR